MVTNAMFYQVGGQADPSTTLHLGPFAFSPSQIGIGLMTSLIIFPVNILIVGKFLEYLKEYFVNSKTDFNTQC